MPASIEITPVINVGPNLIRGYGKGGFRVGANVQHHAGSVIVFPASLCHWQHPPLAEISLNDLQPVVAAAAETDILVFGCGASFTAPSSSLREGLRKHGIVLEWMDTGAACRTFNLLLSEGRLVAAALIAID